MKVLDFIDGIANSTLKEHDIITFIDKVENKVGLLWDLHFASIECSDDTGKPRITDDRQINRISNAIDFISDRYNINMLDEELSRTSNQEHELHLPDELDTEQAIKYFSRALEVGYIEQTNTGYKWLYGETKGQVRLGYFCNKVYSTPRPINKLEELFGVKKLSSSISSADCEAKRADVKKWRKEMIDTLFFD